MELLLEHTPSEALTSHPLLTTEASDNERGDEPIKFTFGVEWIVMVDMEILDKLE